MKFKNRVKKGWNSFEDKSKETWKVWKRHPKKKKTKN